MKYCLLLIAVLAATPAFACTLCQSGTAKEIRSLLLGQDLAINLAVTILPFLVCAVIIYLIYYGGIPGNRPAHVKNVRS